jgi:hypothetical protein
MNRKSLILSLSVVATLLLALFFLFKYAASLQKDTCKSTIEFSLVAAINRKKITIETPLDSSWREFDLTGREKLLDFIKENEAGYTECTEHSYLIKGKEFDGTDLPILVRKDKGEIEIQLGK